MAGKTFAMASVVTALAAFTGLVFALDGMVAARNDDAAAAAVKPAAPAPAADDHATGHGQAQLAGVKSYAGLGAANAADLAASHEPYPAAMPPVPAGDVVPVHMTLKDVTIEIAPGVKYTAWGFAGGAPGPVVHVRQGLDTDFHVVGTVFDRVYPFQDMNPEHALNGVQTFTVPAGGGGVFEVRIDEPGLYPFVSHSFASVDLGQVGLLKVGDVDGTMSH